MSRAQPRQRDPRLALTLELARQLIGTPRHLSQHPGGFVLTRDRLDDLVPIEPAAMEDRQVIEWDKDDIEELKFMKVDVLGLGMLGCMRRAFDLLTSTRASARPRSTRCRRTIRRLRHDLQGRHARHLPDRKPRADEHAAAHEAARILRHRHRGRDRAAGPIQGDMVHPYLRRREGKEKPNIRPSCARCSRRRSACRSSRSRR
jgi:error-prone DNA polymerase